MLFSEMEKDGVFRDVIKITATKLGMGNVEWKSNSELLEAIEDKDAALSKDLVGFLNAWDKWYQYHRNNEKMGKFDLDSKDKEILVDLMGDRDSAREKILDRIHSLGLC